MSSHAERARPALISSCTLAAISFRLVQRDCQRPKELARMAFRFFREVRFTHHESLLFTESP